jgi:hypothetical protein
MKARRTLTTALAGGALLLIGAGVANGDNRPDDADGTDTQFPGPDPRFVEGPAGGLVKNGPLG